MCTQLPVDFELGVGIFNCISVGGADWRHWPQDVVQQCCDHIKRMQADDCLCSRWLYLVETPSYGVEDTRTIVAIARGACDVQVDCVAPPPPAPGAVPSQPLAPPRLPPSPQAPARPTPPKARPLAPPLPPLPGTPPGPAPPSAASEPAPHPPGHSPSPLPVPESGDDGGAGDDSKGGADVADDDDFPFWLRLDAAIHCDRCLDATAIPQNDTAPVEFMPPWSYRVQPRSHPRVLPVLLAYAFAAIAPFHLDPDDLMVFITGGTWSRDEDGAIVGTLLARIDVPAHSTSDMDYWASMSPAAVQAGLTGIGMTGVTFAAITGHSFSGEDVGRSGFPAPPVLWFLALAAVATAACAALDTARSRDGGWCGGALGRRTRPMHAEALLPVAAAASVAVFSWFTASELANAEGAGLLLHASAGLLGASLLFNALAAALLGRDLLAESPSGAFHYHKAGDSLEDPPEYETRRIVRPHKGSSWAAIGGLSPPLWLKAAACLGALGNCGSMKVLACDVAGRWSACAPAGCLAPLALAGLLSSLLFDTARVTIVALARQGAEPQGRWPPLAQAAVLTSASVMLLSVVSALRCLALLRKEGAGGLPPLADEAPDGSPAFRARGQQSGSPLCCELPGTFDASDNFTVPSAPGLRMRAG